MTRCAAEPLDETGRAFETLLFYGRQARQLLESEGAAVLRRELARAHVRVSIRLTDERGVVRAELYPTRAPLDRRHVFEMKTHNVQPLVVSGTVKRVGLYHLWKRL